MLLACSDSTPPGDVKIVTDADTSQISPGTPTNKEVIQRKSCTIVRVDYESMCDIYTLDCEGETEYSLVCHIKPIGKITNPPRPIKIIVKQDSSYYHNKCKNQY